MNPLVSIMIPTFNQDKYIIRAVNSVLMQTYKNIEIIISDDSTNNKTEFLINAYYKDNPNIRYIHNIPSKGKTNNYRYLLYNLVKGEYTINLDGDDYFEDENFIKDAVDFIQKYKLIMVIAKQKIVNELTNNVIYPTNDKEEILIKNGKEIFLNSIFKNIEIPHLATIYNTELAKKIGFYEYDIPSTEQIENLYLNCVCMGKWEF